MTRILMLSILLIPPLLASQAEDAAITKALAAEEDRLNTRWDNIVNHSLPNSGSNPDQIRSELELLSIIKTSDDKQLRKAYAITTLYKQKYDLTIYHWYDPEKDKARKQRIRSTEGLLQVLRPTPINPGKAKPAPPPSSSDVLKDVMQDLDQSSN